MNSANSGYNQKLPALDDENFIPFFKKANGPKFFEVFYQLLKTYLESNNEFNDIVKNNIKWIVNIIFSQQKYYQDKYNEACRDMRKEADEKEKQIQSLRQSSHALTNLVNKERSKNAEMSKMEENYKDVVKEKAEINLKIDDLKKYMEKVLQQNEALKTGLKNANQENDNSNKRESTMNEHLKIVQNSADSKLQKTKNEMQKIIDTLTKNLEEKCKEKDFLEKEVQTFKENFCEVLNCKSEAAKLLEIAQNKQKEYEEKCQVYIKRVHLATACTEEIVENVDKTVASPDVKRQKTSDVLPLEHSLTTASTSNNPFLQQHELQSTPTPTTSFSASNPQVQQHHLQSTSTPTLRQLLHQPPTVIPTTSFFNQNYMYQPPQQQHGYGAPTLFTKYFASGFEGPN